MVTAVTLQASMCTAYLPFYNLAKKKKKDGKSNVVTLIPAWWALPEGWELSSHYDPHNGRKERQESWEDVLTPYLQHLL